MKLSTQSTQRDRYPLAARSHVAGRVEALAARSFDDFVSRKPLRETAISARAMTLVIAAILVGVAINIVAIGISMIQSGQNG